LFPGKFDVDVGKNHVLAEPLIKRRCVLNMHVNMRPIGISRIPAFAEFLSHFDAIPRLYFDGAFLKMRQENKAIVSHLNDDMISGRMFRVFDTKEIIGKFVHGALDGSTYGDNTGSPQE
jgi:hypothetical protein